MVDRHARLREQARWLVLAIAGVVLVVHSLTYNFVTDDAYISFVFSRNFAEHGELTFNLGDPVEGYTNFSWTVLLGLIMKLGIAPELSSRVLGTLCALGTLVLAMRVMERALGRPSPWSAVPSVLLACSSGFACWTSGGLETQLFALLCTAALDGVVAAVTEPRALRRAAICLALAAMTRPEGPLVAVVLGVVWLAHRGLQRRAGVQGPPGAGGLRAELVAAAWFLGLWAPWFAWRWWYYGHPFPNTYYVKAAGAWTNPAFASQMRDHGLHYVWVWLEQTRLLYALPLALVGTFAIKPRTPRFVLGASCALLAFVYLGYTISVGGDFMGLHRFIMPVFVIAAIAVVLGLEWLAGWLPERAVVFPGSPRLLGALIVIGVTLLGFAIWRLPDAVGAELPISDPRRWVPVLGLVAAMVPLLLGRGGRHLAASAGVLLVVAFATTQAHLTAHSLDPKHLAADRGVIDTPAFLIVYTEDRAKIGRAMAPCFAPEDFSIVGGAGAQPYFGRMRAIDVFGLVSDRIAHGEPRSRPRAGHTKWGSEQVLAGYDPDFVFSCYRIHKTPAQPQLPCAGFWLRRGFEHVTMHVPGMVEQGEYYTFLAKRSRRFTCPGRVK